jgi:hypothetical protein
VRCLSIKKKIADLTQKYMQLVEKEEEMRYLLLEKDFENRDSLDLITRYHIEELLQSQFADNVVKEIWRSPYATNNSVFSASTNHNLTFNYFHCVRDEESDKRFYQRKNITEDIEAHPLQFTVWRYSGKSRMLVEFFATLILTIIMHWVISLALSQAPAYKAEINNFLAVE